MKDFGTKQIEFLKEKHYLEENETIDQRINSIIEVVRGYESKYSEGLADRLKDLIERKIFCPSTPQWGNVGRKKTGKTSPLPCSCNIITVPNSIQEIYYSIAETAMLSKLGAGVGIDISSLSPKGTYLQEGFYTNSKYDWAEDMIRTSQKVSQNSLRRGYAVIFESILSPELPALLKRLDRRNPNQYDPFIDNNVGIFIPTGFMVDMRAGNQAYREVFLKVLKLRKDVGKIYLVFEDNLNKNQSPVYKKLNHRVVATNICCVTGDQLVATEDGFKTVKELSDSNEKLKLFDNEGIYNSSAMLIRGNTDVYKITLKNGMTHTITSNHDLVVNDTILRKTYKQSLDNGLKVGKKVLFQTKKGLFGKRSEPKLAFLLGLFLGDGSQSNNSTKISLWEKDFDLIEEIENTCKEFYNRENIKLHSNNKIPLFKDSDTGDSKVCRKDLHTTLFNNNGFEFKKGHIPNWILDADEESQWQLLRGLFYSDGTIGNYNKGKSFGNPVSLSLASININLLRIIQILCVNLGLNAKIYNLRKQTKSYLPKNDNSGDYKEYNSKDIFRLVISNKNDLLKIEENTKFLSRKNVKIKNRYYRDNSLKSSEIVSIDYIGKEDVYCPTVDSEKHLWICNGLITSNTEVVSPQYDDKTFSCIIASLNLVHWDYIKANKWIIRDCYMFLDIMVEEYIKLSEGVKFLEKARKSAIEKRDIGLGTLGFHDYIQSKGYAFGDIGSRLANKEIYSTIREVCDETNDLLATQLGACSMAIEAGLNYRNVSQMMVAPNKTTSFIAGDPIESPAGVSLGIEPIMSNYLIKALAGIQEVYKNPRLIKLLESKGKNDAYVWESILEKLGSVQHLNFLSKEEKDIFKTFSEISPKDIIDLASDRQVYIDMAQSINLVTRPNYNLKDIYDIHMYAYDRNIKTLYYMYPQAHSSLEQAGDKWDTCASCAD